jgi:hypothetical protein
LDEDKADDEQDNGLTDEWSKVERKELIAHAWDDFLIQNEHPACPSLAL